MSPNRNVFEARKAWRAKAREELRRPRFWLLIAFLYVATFVISAALMSALDWIVPQLPWTPKPYESPDRPPVATAFYCANMIPISLLVTIPLLYFMGWPPSHPAADRIP
jgi:hypothetical protein